MEAIRDVLGEDPQVLVHPQVKEGHAAKLLIDLSKDADVLVVGSRGHGGFAGMLLGSVSQHVAAYAECTVVVARQQAESGIDTLVGAVTPRPRAASNDEMSELAEAGMPPTLSSRVQARRRLGNGQGMMSAPRGALDVLAIGEMVVDFISVEQTDTPGNAATFGRYLGGSPANIAVYVSQIGGRSAVIAKTGIGAFGQFLKGEFQRYGVNTDYLLMDHCTHTTVIFVSSTATTPDFEEFRSGDYLLRPEEVSEEAIDRARVVHASAFALSCEPCRSAVIEAFRKAHDGGKIVSLDPNYSRRIWPDFREARKVLREAYRYVGVTKPSLDDARRVFGPDYEPEQYIEKFHELGPATVVLTMGKGGVLVSENGDLAGHIPARPVEVVDATGAGDSFWAGFLLALLDDNPVERSVLFAREVVEMKLTTKGPLPSDVDREEIYARLEDEKPARDEKRT